MKLNWFSYYPQYDGYGRFSSRMVQALQRAGAEVFAYHLGDLERPPWLLEQMQIDWDCLTITCCPPFMLKRVPGRHWLFSMTEGSQLPDGWAETINHSGVERVLVPCRHNAEAFRNSGLQLPVSIIPGGTDPQEFPLIIDRPKRPYTFLTFADRNERKGWQEVWDAFYLAFGGKTTGTMDVRLLIKYRPDENNVTSVMANAEGLDPRIIFWGDDVSNIADVYAQADCLALPSRSEGWGMPHREAGMSGLPVITQAYSGMDDGHTREWAIVVEQGEMRPIPKERAVSSLGEWRVADKQELAAKMRRCYEQPPLAAAFGQQAARWLCQHQTWGHSANSLIDLIGASEPAAPSVERYASLRDTDTGGYEYAV